MSELSRIRLLPPEVQNQIAAGEVVERPSSVVKELLENALDANASRIQLEIREGGQSYIRMRDDGIGIAADQLELALTRHATSKLSSVHDLTHLTSFGFRGEALPSIASVSRLRITSAMEAGEGTTLYVEYGRILSTNQTGIPRGTEIEITDLFSNVPARLKFLKQPATEARKCIDAVARTALANLHVDFEVTNADRIVHRFLHGETLAQRLATIWPPTLLDMTHRVSFADGPIHVSGLVGAPAQAQARADRILLYVNRRPVQDKTMLSAIRDAYKGRILGKEYPQAIIFLELPADEVDVNVHPAKTEVRFQNENDIFRVIRRAVLSALDSAAEMTTAHVLPARQYAFQLEHSLNVPMTAPVQHVRESNAEYHSTVPPKFSAAAAARDLFTPSIQPQIQESFHASLPANQAPQADPALTPSSRLPLPAFLGQLAATYLILTDGTELTLMDQHAAHERVLFHALRSQGSKGDRQPLLMPLEIPLHRSQVGLLEEIWTNLTDLGFSLELTAGPTLSVLAIPMLLRPGKAKEFLVESLLEKAATMEDLWAIMACKAAIKAGDVLTQDEALALIESWAHIPDNAYCPHGRPVVLRWGTTELEKLFKRRA